MWAPLEGHAAVVGGIPTLDSQQQPQGAHTGDQDLREGHGQPPVVSSGHRPGFSEQGYGAKTGLEESGRPSAHRWGAASVSGVGHGGLPGREAVQARCGRHPWTSHVRVRLRGQGRERFMPGRERQRGRRDAPRGWDTRAETGRGEAPPGSEPLQRGSVRAPLGRVPANPGQARWREVPLLSSGIESTWMTPASQGRECVYMSVCTVSVHVVRTQSCGAGVPGWEGTWELRHCKCPGRGGGRQAGPSEKRAGCPGGECRVHTSTY